MKINGNNYNFGRVVYLTIGKKTQDPYKFNGELQNLTDVVTIAFDPKTNAQLNTRIDFLVRHQYGKPSAVTGAAYSLASIDLYNIGPALQQFINAYNATEKGRWKALQVANYCCALQVGYYGEKPQTIFAGVINSYNVERKQTANQVDTIWHLFASGTGGYNPIPVSQTETATSGEDYTEELQRLNQTLKTYTSGEQYIKAIVMEHPRTVYPLTDTGVIIEGDSFIVQDTNSDPSLIPLPQPIKINNQNFNKYFQIKYQKFDSSTEEEWNKAIWQTEAFKSVPTVDSFDLEQAISDIARTRNCSGEVRLDESTGKQTIYIYSNRAGSKSSQRQADYIIKDFQNLRKPPMVSGTLIRFDLLLEPSVRPNKTFELQITNGFLMEHQKSPSFSVNFGEDLGYWTSVFAGANFAGLSDTVVSKKTKEKMSQTGNVFNKRFEAMYVVHQGSTHGAEWSTQVDCANVVE